MKHYFRKSTSIAIISGLLICIASSSMALPATPLPVGQTGNWVLIFNDEFDGTTIEPEKWTTCYWWGNDGCTIATNNELQWYQSDDVLVSNGAVKLRAQQQPVTTVEGKVYRYTSGVITTDRNTWDTSAPPKFAYLYGYAEIRAKVPYGQGLWPAFWIAPAAHTWLPEIDVMEILGHEPDIVHMHFHYQDSNGNIMDSGDAWKGPDFSADWHTFAVSWQPDAVIWYVDGIERRRYTDTAYIPSEPDRKFVGLWYTLGL
jgi:beta-glucanase (GH16 family)